MSPTSHSVSPESRNKKQANPTADLLLACIRAHATSSRGADSACASAIARSRLSSSTVFTCGDRCSACISAGDTTTTRRFNLASISASEAPIDESESPAAIGTAPSPLHAKNSSVSAAMAAGRSDALRNSATRRTSAPGEPLFNSAKRRLVSGGRASIARTQIAAAWQAEACALEMIEHGRE
eukprot:4988943-Pleurochrysis_carterae.AAC.2